MTHEEPRAIDAYRDRIREELFRDTSIAWGYGIVVILILGGIAGILGTAHRGDVNLDGLFTISDVLQAAGQCLTMISSYLLAQLGPEFWTFFEIAPWAIPAWITFPIAIVGWLVLGYVIGIALYYIAKIVRRGYGEVQKVLPGSSLGDTVVGGLVATFVVLVLVAWISTKLGGS